MNAKTWNEKYPIGTAVIVRRDNGDELHTTTRSEAWELGHGTPVIKVQGIAGGYRLDRVTPDMSKKSKKTGV
jgi:hypothetical protein